ncbi:L,D-transpeptidase [Streptomyces sp. NPDC047014]|uniref:L,D-transpeptidase n=1 Tax=Streptomyces sp. NPDC047014 TaxID=3155736 RepID=UPI0033CD07B2
MSDQPPPRLLTEEELSARLRGLAAERTATAPATGAQVRNRARLRRRGRRVLLSTAATAVAALAALTAGALTSSDGQPAPPAAPPAAPTPAPVQRVTIDLDAYTLTIEGRTFRISGLQESCPIGETTVTVTAKYPSLTMPPDEFTSLTGIEVRQWAVTFTDRGRQHERLLMSALDPAAGLASIGRDAGDGAIALSPEDGKWVYDAIQPGARVEIKGWQAASPDPETTCSGLLPLTVAR